MTGAWRSNAIGLMRGQPASWRPARTSQN